MTITLTREEAQQVLVVLEYPAAFKPATHAQTAALLRTRLAQPEPEPWCRDFMQHSWVEVVNEDGDIWILDPVLEVGRIEAATKAGLSVTPLYKKKEWQELTDEEAAEVERWVEFKEEGSGRIPTGKLIRYIEAKLQEKNT
jgi:hypothetical protein